MTEKDEAEIDWSLCTWKGSRRLQHERFRALTFAEKLACIEEMNDFSAERMGKSIAQPKSRGNATLAFPAAPRSGTVTRAL